jgi:hypothetical protein
MKIGDLIKISDLPQGDNRETGLVIRFDMWPTTTEPFTQFRESPRRVPERIVEVQWNNGSIGWILQARTEVINESR